MKVATRARWVAPLIVVAVLLGGACGSKDNGGVITPSGDTPTTVSTP